MLKLRDMSVVSEIVKIYNDIAVNIHAKYNATYPRNEYFN